MTTLMLTLTKMYNLKYLQNNDIILLTYFVTLLLNTATPSNPRMLSLSHVSCPSQGRTSLFHNSVSELVGWLKEVDTDPFLVVKPFCSVEASSLLSRFHMMLLMRMSWCLNKCVFLALITLSRVVYHQFWSTSNVNILYRLPP